MRCRGEERGEERGEGRSGRGAHRRPDDQDERGRHRSRRDHHRQRGRADARRRGAGVRTLGDVPGQPQPPAQHQVDVRRRVVVRQDGRLQVCGVAQVAAAQAQVRRRRGRRVEDVLRVAGTVAVAVAAEGAPGAGDELHRPDRAVPAAVAVQRAAVGVVDRGVPATGQDRPVHAGHRAVVAVDRAARERSRLDLADRGQQAHRQVAPRGCAGHRGPVGREQRPRHRRPAERGDRCVRRGGALAPRRLERRRRHLGRPHHRRRRRRRAVVVPDQLDHVGWCGETVLDRVRRRPGRRG